MPHRFELTRPALRILFNCAQGREPDEEDIRELRAHTPSLDLSPYELATYVIEIERKRRYKT